MLAFLIEPGCSYEHKMFATQEGLCFMDFFNYGMTCYHGRTLYDIGLYVYQAMWKNMVVLWIVCGFSISAVCRHFIGTDVLRHQGRRPETVR